jgi:hypothetical protein
MSPATEVVGTVSISSDPDGAKIFVDDKFHGNTPATVRLPAGAHAIVLNSPAMPSGAALSKILKSSKTSLKATLDPAP